MDSGFSWGGTPTPKVGVLAYFFVENYMKMKEFGPRGGRASLATPDGSANAEKAGTNVDPVRLSSKTSFSLEFALGLVSIYLYPLLSLVCLHV